MDYKEYKRELDLLAPRLKEYADLLVNFAMRIEPGQKMVIQCPLEAADFARLVAKKAYEAKCGALAFVWNDDALSRMEFENLSEEALADYPKWKAELFNGLSDEKAAFLTLYGSDPDHLKGIDAAKIALAQKARIGACQTWRNNLDYGNNAWTIAGVPTFDWASKVFPDCDHFEAYIKLWHAILDTARITSNAREEWETHTAMLEKARGFMNRHHFKSLHYTSSNGTDLIVGLLDKGTWEGGPMPKKQGGMFYPNIPTEEVFTSPDWRATEGVVYSALPLAHAGSIVRDFWFRFENGKVVDYDAAQGKSVLTSILEADEGSASLGECALISKNTPIRQSGLIFFSTLFDENASCHLAIGRGFPDCYEGGYDLSPDELSKAGVNVSTQHVDFMVGADDLNITGITADGEEVDVFVNGEWAWE